MSSNNKDLSRRDFLSRGTKLASGLFGAAALAACSTTGSTSAMKQTGGDKDAAMKFGLVTYLWGKDWELPALLRNCERAGVKGVELRVDHAHGVSPALSAKERELVRLRFENSPVTLVGFGTNYEFHSQDPDEVEANIDGAMEFIRLGHDVGASGVKVKPNTIPDGASEEKTIVQIGKSLNRLAEFGEAMGQEIRVEVHGRITSRLPIMERIFDVADHPNVGVCWNSNNVDLEDPGLAHNFQLVQDRLSATTHIREMNVGDYPYQDLFNLFVKANYGGWILLEARSHVPDRIIALQEQRELFESMVQKAGGRTA
jgi:sugar phosphate isomerase/epimerase